MRKFDQSIRFNHPGNALNLDEKIQTAFVRFCPAVIIVKFIIVCVLEIEFESRIKESFLPGLARHQRLLLSSPLPTQPHTAHPHQPPAPESPFKVIFLNAFTHAPSKQKKSCSLVTPLNVQAEPPVFVGLSVFVHAFLQRFLSNCVVEIGNCLGFRRACTRATICIIKIHPGLQLVFGLICVCVCACVKVISSGLQYQRHCVGRVWTFRFSFFTHTIRQEACFHEWMRFCCVACPVSLGVLSA